MAELAGYQGDVMVEVMMVWDMQPQPGSLSATALATKPDLELQLTRGRICHNLMESIVINVRGRTLLEPQLTGIKSRKTSILDRKAGTYHLGPIAARELDGLIQARMLSVRLSWTHRKVFALILREWQSSDFQTLANRKDDDPILTSIIGAKELEDNDRPKRYEYVEQPYAATIDGRIIDHQIQAWPKHAPVVRLKILLEPSPDLEGDFSLATCAADWTSLAKFKVSAPVSSTAIPAHHRLGFLNIQQCIAATANVDNGGKIFGSIVKNNMWERDAKDLVTSVRADIDKYIIAANHWGEDREALKSTDPVERYQSWMSDFFGMLYEDYTLASPVNIARGLFAKKGAFGITLFDLGDDETLLWLQLGVGHCGEHANAGFFVLREIIEGNVICPLHSLILSGNANIDHAFVLVNLEIDTVHMTRVLNPNNKLFPIGYTLKVFDLADALKQPRNANALVHDAYLQFSRFDAKATVLLHSLMHKKNKALHTTFVNFDRAYPTSPRIESSVELPDAELRKTYPNI